MDLTSDLPFWTIRNGLLHSYPALDRNLKCDAVVIGGGISGALLANQLVKRGVDCVLIDRRDIGQGSTSASTALLQYEIDTPLYKLRVKVGAEAAESAYLLGIDAIHRLQKLAGPDCGFKRRPSLQIAMRQADVPGLRKEYEARRRLKLPVSMMERRDLRAIGIEGAAALRSTIAGEVDPYRFTHQLLRSAHRNGLRIFDRTRALRYEQGKYRTTVVTDRDARIECKGVFFATGYETRDILPRRIVTFKSTYAFISEPLANLHWWKSRALIWGTGDPYPYMRTTSDNRVIAGGEDDKVLDPKRRDKQIAHKTSLLLRRFHSLFPDVRLEPAFAWAGAFGSTRDGLGYIGRHASFPQAWFALGFGGNGITFSEIASQILPDLFLGKRNGDEKIFSFER